MSGPFPVSARNAALKALGSSRARLRRYDIRDAGVVARSLRARSGPHARALRLVSADVTPSRRGSGPLLAAEVIQPARHIEPYHQIARAALLGFLLRRITRRGSGRSSGKTRSRPQ